MPDIEREVKRLLRMDNEAIDVKWEVVIESDKPQDAHSGEKQVRVVCARASTRCGCLINDVSISH